MRAFVIAPFSVHNTQLRFKVMAPSSDEIRILREAVTSLQWGLVQTLVHIEDLGEQVEANAKFLQRVNATRQSVMQLRSSPQNLTENGE